MTGMTTTPKGWITGGKVILGAMGTPNSPIAPGNIRPARSRGALRSMRAGCRITARRRGGLSNITQGPILRPIVTGITTSLRPLLANMKVDSPSCPWRRKPGRPLSGRLRKHHAGHPASQWRNRPSFLGLSLQVEGGVYGLRAMEKSIALSALTWDRNGN